MTDRCHERTSEGWSLQNSARRCDVELTFFNTIQGSYPNYHVTRTDPDKCDLFGYANAGHATAICDNSHKLRFYEAPSSRVHKMPGQVKDKVKFGKWAYNWDSNDYIIYQSEYDVQFRPAQQVLFVLSPKSTQTTSDIEEDRHSATDLLLLTVGSWSSKLHEEIYVFDDEAWRKDSALYESVKHTSWDDVILNSKLKNNLISDVQGFFNNQPLYKKLAVPWKRGIIMHGMPGNGKTISIKALINSLSKREDPVPSLYVKSFDGCHGPKWSIRQIFKRARTMAPCLLILEDLDSLVTNKTRSYFLNEVDGLEANDGILMIGSTNHLEKLDASISKRPSRFDRKYHFKLPSEKERIAYCMFWREKLIDSDMVDFSEDLCSIIAKFTEGFSFAYLKELFVIALLVIARGSVESTENLDHEIRSSSSTDDGIVVEKDDTMETAVSNKGVAPQDVPCAEEKRTIGNVDIPVHLETNVFLEVLITQAAILLDEMESTGEEPSGETSTDKELELKFAFGNSCC